MDTLSSYQSRATRAREGQAAYANVVDARAKKPPQKRPLEVEEALEAQAMQAEKTQRLVKALLDKEFWTQDIAQSAVITGKNLAASTLGLFGDFQDISPVLKDAPRQLPNSEELANKFGGDTSHLSWWPTQLLAPGPGEAKTGLASLGGLVGWATKHGDEFALGAKKYKDFLRLEKKLGSGPMDVRTVAETGWIRGHDGMPKFVIDDSKMAIKEVSLKEGKNVIKFGDMVEHDELFKAYPDVANIKLTVYGEALEDGRVVMSKAPTEGPLAEYIRRSPWQNDEINVYGATGIRGLKGSLLHEASHFIQEVEGFSSGAKGMYTKEFMDELSIDVMASQMLKHLSQEELSNPEKVIEFISKAAGPDAKEKTVTELSNIARMYGRLDNASFAGQTVAVHSKVNSSLSRLGHVFEFVLKKKDPSQTEMIMNLLNSSDNPELLSSLSSVAYELKLGEVEARLAGLTQDWDLAQWSKLKEDPIETLLKSEDVARMGPTDTKYTDDLVVGQRGDRKVKDAELRKEL